MTSFSSELILARLQTLHPRVIDLSLGRIRRLLEALGHPERDLPPVVHIAGTNGKGSTLAMLDAMLSASGLRVHRYISPHLVHFNERILLQGRPIAEPLLADVLDECERANRGEPITFFEITTAAAFLAFRHFPADLLLLETGLGGRLDATNVIARPRLTLISPISLDHEAHLGRTVGAIAAEKAGILKPGVPALVAAQPAEAAAVLRARGRWIGAPLRFAGEDWRVERSSAAFRYEEKGGDMLELPLPALAGRHQIENAGLAVAAARMLAGDRLDAACMARGLTGVRWPARLERLDAAALGVPLSPPSELWLDGGHNPAAGSALARSLPELAGEKEIHLVVGMLRTKDMLAFLRPLAPVVRSITVVPVPDEPMSHEPEQAARCLASAGIPAAPCAHWHGALVELGRKVRSPALVLVCGSLYLAGAVLRTGHPTTFLHDGAGPANAL